MAWPARRNVCGGTERARGWGRSGWARVGWSGACSDARPPPERAPVGTGRVTGLLVAILLVGLAATAGLCAARVRRLHRLHVRLDAARAGLDAALARRAVAAARAGVLGTTAGDRQAAANDLGRRLAALDRAPLPPGTAAELAEAEALLVIARHVHNDAVRDTLALRSRRLVRLLRLAGTAPMPAYFEIADPGAVTRGTVEGRRA